MEAQAEEAGDYTAAHQHLARFFLAKPVRQKLAVEEEFRKMQTHDRFAGFFDFFIFLYFVLENTKRGITSTCYLFPVCLFPVVNCCTSLLHIFIRLVGAPHLGADERPHQS